MNHVSIPIVHSRYTITVSILVGDSSEVDEPSHSPQGQTRLPHKRIVHIDHYMNLVDSEMGNYSLSTVPHPTRQIFEYSGKEVCTLTMSRDIAVAY